MANETEAQIVARQALAAQTQGRPSEATYVIFAATLEATQFEQVTTITVPSRTHMETVFRQAFKEMADGTTVTDMKLMAVPEKFAQQKRVYFASDPRVVIEDAA